MKNDFLATSSEMERENTAARPKALSFGTEWQAKVEDFLNRSTDLDQSECHLVRLLLVPPASIVMANSFETNLFFFNWPFFGGG
jgi:hypothetical protein